MAVAKIFELRDAFFVKETDQDPRGQPQGYAKFPAGNEDVPVDIARYCPKTVLEFQWMRLRQPRMGSA